MAITDYLNKTLTGGTENNTDSPITDLVNKNLGSTTPVAQNATTGNNQTSDQIVGGVNITELANRLKSGQDTIKMPEETSIVSDSESIRNKEDETAAKIIEESNKETQNSQTELAKLKSQAELRTARVAAGLDPDTGEKATAKKTLLSTYEGLYADSGIEKLDTQLNDVNAEIDTLNSAKEAVLASVKEKFLLTGKRDLETTEASNNFNEEINKLQNKANLLTNQINTKTSAISTIMKYTETDYNTASSQYQTDFDNNYKLMSYYDTKSSNEVITATSNLNTMSSALSNANLTWEEIDDATKAKISQLELEAGIPTGYTEAILSAVPGATVLSSKFSYDSDGNEMYTQIIEDGEGNTQVIKTPTGNVNTKLINSSTTEEKRFITPEFLLGSDSIKPSASNYVEGYSNFNMDISSLAKAAKALGYGQWNKSGATEAKEMVSDMSSGLIESLRVEGISDAEITEKMKQLFEGAAEHWRETGNTYTQEELDNIILNL